MALSASAPEAFREAVMGNTHSEALCGTREAAMENGGSQQPSPPLSRAGPPAEPAPQPSPPRSRAGPSGKPRPQNTGPQPSRRQAPPTLTHDPPVPSVAAPTSGKAPPHPAPPRALPWFRRIGSRRAGCARLSRELPGASCGACWELAPFWRPGHLGGASAVSGAGPGARGPLRALLWGSDRSPPSPCVPGTARPPSRQQHGGRKEDGE